MTDFSCSEIVVPGLVVKGSKKAAKLQATGHPEHSVANGQHAPEQHVAMEDGLESQPRQQAVAA